MIFLLAVLTVSAAVGEIDLDLEGPSATIPKGNTVERSIIGVPSGVPGNLSVKLKWHSVSDSPRAHDPLVIRVINGTEILRTSICYSIHSNRSPKCDLRIPVNRSESNLSGPWKLRITNNGNNEVVGFDIRKGGDPDPLVPGFRSVFMPACPGAARLDMEGTTLTLTKGSTQERKIFGVGSAAGLLRLKAKWHSANNGGGKFIVLEIRLIRPDGSIARTGSYYSIHSKNTQKFDITYKISPSDASLAGTWKLRITNGTEFDVTGFNIERERGEGDPLVPGFSSSYEADCN
ncbi:MAG: hypothetical protein IPM25_15555 [Chloracidobacterium sp.]|nr:hypothetical protein [Chloracidobacterium sp.]